MSDFNEPPNIDDRSVEPPNIDERSVEPPSDVSSRDLHRSERSSFPPVGYSVISAWGRVLSGTVMSFAGICAGAYVLKNVEQPTGWALTSFTVGAAGVYITCKSLCNLRCPTRVEGVYNLRHETAADYEEAYFAQHPDPQSRVLAEFSNPNSQPPAQASAGENPYDLPEASLSDVSSDILNLNLGNYLPRSTDLSFRPSDIDKKKRKKCLTRDWSSAPSILHKKEDFVMSFRKDVEKEAGEAEEPSHAPLRSGQEVVSINSSTSDESLL